MPTDSPYLPYLRRTGLVLLIVGVVDIAVLLYCVVHGISYASSFNIFSVVGGIFLMRGSLRAASIVRRMSLSMLALLAAVVVVSPVLQPPSLTVAMIKTHATLALLGGVMFVATAALLWWLARELGSAPVLAAIAASGRKVRSLRWPVAMGGGIAVLLAGVSMAIQHTDAAARAIAQARAAEGDAYRYHVSQLQMSTTAAGREVSGTVSAWNEHGVKSIPFRWRE